MRYIIYILTFFIILSPLKLYSKNNTYIFKESPKIQFINKLKPKHSLFHIQKLHYITKVGTRLPKHINKPMFINLMPSNINHYKNIYDTDSVTITAKSQIEKYNKELNDKIFQNESIFSKNKLLEFIKKNDAIPIIIFGHSINGKTLVLANGDKYSITNIHQQCKKNSKTCLILTCDGDDFNIHGKVTAFEALDMYQAAYASFNKSEIFKVDDFRITMINERELQKNKSKIVLSFTTVSISSGATYLVYDFVKDKK